MPNLWWGLDESAFLYTIVYGVLDDNNNWVTGVTWDPPFPQNAQQYATAVTTFFARLKALAPDIRTMINLGSMDFPENIPTEFADIGGMIMEGYYDTNPAGPDRDDWMRYFPNLTWFGNQGKPIVMRALLPAGDSIINPYAEYEVLKGYNCFFAAMYAGTSNQVPVSTYAQMDADLGTPLADFESQPVAGLGIGHRLFWRRFDGGVVYFNWTGSPQTVTLPTDRSYYDPRGQSVTTIAVSDGGGAYVRTTAVPKAMRPSIDPRFGVRPGRSQ